MLCSIRMLRQVGLILGEAWPDWGPISDVVAVYDKLIIEHRQVFFTRSYSQGMDEMIGSCVSVSLLALCPE
jgi:hypothetical protein